MKKDDIYRLGERYVSVRYFWLYDTFQNNELTITYCLTIDMIADMFTKPLSRDKLEQFRMKLGVV